ncbi:hypothetical protein [Streptomyces nodosus]|uniref:hypothetical protein n=1 Tax=Streptomyces nodosus TaxID=40318 RepID=UPI003828363C
MGVLRRIRRRPAGRRAVLVTGLMAVTVGGVSACQPGDMGSTAVAYTTSRTATRELERQHVKVSWLSCTGGYRTRTTPAIRTPSPSETAVVTVDCRGKADDGRDIIVKGTVTRAVDGACVRGDLRATVGGKEWFHVRGLGDCNATVTPAPPVTWRPTVTGHPWGPGPTVTVTKTIWCQSDPVCRPVRGK